LSEKKIYTPIKNLVSEKIYPKTTHTLLTVYYTSYIKTNFPQTTDTFYKSLIRYFCINDSSAAFAIKVINSTKTDPLLAIFILYQNGKVYKNYTVTADTPKQVIDLTAQFILNEIGGDLDEFYQHCVNILSNIFISYTYED
jgi:hypothetical protein